MLSEVAQFVAHQTTSACWFTLCVQNLLLKPAYCHCGSLKDLSILSETKTLENGHDIQTVCSKSSLIIDSV